MMGRMKITGAVLVAVLMLSGCSGGDDEAAAPSADDLAAQLDCTGDSNDAADKVSCETDDAFFGITVYSDNDARDVDVQAAESGGAQVLVGDRFVIDASDPMALERAQGIVGGELSG